MRNKMFCLERVIGRRFILVVVMLLMLLMLWVMAVVVMVGGHLSLTVGTLGILCLQAVGHTETVLGNVVDPAPVQ